MEKLENKASESNNPQKRMVYWDDLSREEQKDLWPKLSFEQRFNIISYLAKNATPYGPL